MLDNKTFPTVLALGYFDSVHLGHQKVIKSAKILAEELCAKLIVVSFSGNLRAVLFGEREKVVYTESERERFYRELGADGVFFAPSTKEFLGMEKKEFLNFLNQKFQVKAYVCGADYRFGKMGEGTTETIKEYASSNNQTLKVLPLENSGGEKISSTKIKKLLSVGDVESANALLGREYSVSGVVFEDRKVGRKIGFPTTNIRLEFEKERLPDGVYLGGVEFDNKRYKAIVNYGARPTYDLENKLVEAHIIDFSGDLYGKEIKVSFTSFMRGIKKFNSESELTEQLKKDLQMAEEKSL